MRWALSGESRVNTVLPWDNPSLHNASVLPPLSAWAMNRSVRDGGHVCVSLGGDSRSWTADGCHQKRKVATSGQSANGSFQAFGIRMVASPRAGQTTTCDGPPQHQLQETLSPSGIEIRR